MSKKSEIKKWLDDPKRKLKTGIALYQEYGVNINIMRAMKRMSDKQKLANLLQVQLKKLIGLSVLPEQVDQEPKKKTPVIDSQTTIEIISQTTAVVDKLKEKVDPYTEVGSRPEELIPIYKQKDEMYVEAKNLHAQLVAKGDEMDKIEDENSDEYLSLQEERHELAKQILEAWNVVESRWNAIDHYKANGELPKPVPVEEIPEIKADEHDPMALDKRWRTLGTYISKAKKQPERNQEKLQDYFTESNAIAEILNKLAGEDKYPMRDETTVKPGGDVNKTEK